MLKAQTRKETGSIMIGLALILLCFVLVVAFAVLKYYVLIFVQTRNIAENAVLSGTVYYSQHFGDSDQLTKSDAVVSALITTNKTLTKFGMFSKENAEINPANLVEGFYDFSDPDCSGTCYTEPTTIIPNALRLSTGVKSGVGKLSALLLVDSSKLKFSRTINSYAAFSNSTGVVIVNPQ
ncbi:MAG: hypothetical protein R3A13_10855 [Bdellovibrionota bacterium]